MSQDIAIKVDGVSKNFRLPHEKITSVKSLFVNPFKSRQGMKTETQHALKDISFEIKKGEFFGIVGRNGSGKSTLLKLLAGIYQPTTGSIQTNGKLVPFIELGVGFNPELTGRENVYLNGALMGFSTGEVDDMYDDIVSFAELEEFMDQKLKNYSSGMQVRLAFSVATRAKADILLIDEVLAVGDADFQRKCFDYFRSLKKNNKTVIFVSHDMNAIREYCDRVVLIDNSNIVAVGSSGKIAREYEKLFINKTDSETTSKTEKRWGNRFVEYSKVEVTPDVLFSSDQEITITTKAVVNQDVEDVLFGFAIKNSSDVFILGNNTKMQNVPFDKLKKGEEITLTWTIPNILGDGDYFINVGTENIAAEPYDWWDEADRLSVRKGTIPGMASYPDVILKVKKK